MKKTEMEQELFSTILHSHLYMGPIMTTEIVMEYIDLELFGPLIEELTDKAKTLEMILSEEDHTAFPN